MRKVIGLALLVVALAAMVGTASAQGNDVIEPFGGGAHVHGVVKPR